MDQSKLSRIESFLEESVTLDGIYPHKTQYKTFKKILEDWSKFTVEEVIKNMYRSLAESGINVGPIVYSVITMRSLKGQQVSIFAKNSNNC